MAVKNSMLKAKKDTQVNGWRASFVYTKDGINFNEAVLNTIKQENSLRSENKNNRNVSEPAARE
jgi:hypothetical protein